MLLHHRNQSNLVKKGIRGQETPSASREENISLQAGAGSTGISKPGHSPCAGQVSHTSPCGDGRRGAGVVLTLGVVRTLGARIPHGCHPGASRSRPPEPPCPSPADTGASSERHPPASSPASARPVLFQQSGSCAPALPGQGDGDRRTSAASPARSRALLVQHSPLTTVSIKRFQGSGEKPQNAAGLGAQSFHGLPWVPGFPLRLALCLFHVVFGLVPRARSAARSHTSAWRSREHPRSHSHSQGVPKKLQPLPQPGQEPPQTPGAGQRSVSWQHVN